MNKYDVWSNLAIDKLNDEFCTGAFRPQNESDVQCHLYHALFETRSQVKGITHNHVILTEVPFSVSGEKFDVAIVRQKKEGFETRLIIEIKETSKGHLTSSEVEERIKPDVEKLRNYGKWLETERKIMMRNYKKPIVFFFFRGAGRHGIAVKTEREMKKLQEKYNDVVLKWGPG